MEENLSISVDGKEIAAVITQPYQKSIWKECGIILTHGAGGDHNSSHLISLTNSLVKNGFIVMRFTCKPPNFEYRVKCYKAVVEFCKESTDMKGCVLGGRSMGGRVAAEVATRLKSFNGFLYGVACFSYPLHKPKELNGLRTLHLVHLQLPVLIINGTQDKMCNKEKMDELISKMSCSVTMHWVKDADHALKLNNKVSAEVVDSMCQWFVEWCQMVFTLEHA